MMLETLKTILKGLLKLVNRGDAAEYLIINKGITQNAKEAF